MPKGRDALHDYLNRQRQEAFSGSRYLFLRDGEAAKIRFLIDQEDLIVDKFHRLETITSSGKTRLGDPIFCPEDDTCEACAQMTKDSERARLLTWYWVWVYHIDHVKPNPSTRAGAKPWEQISRGGTALFRETVEAARLLLAGSRLAGSLDTYYVQLGSITDRDYTFVRRGERLDTEYNLLADVPSALRADIASAATTLADLEDIAYGRADAGIEEAEPEGEVSGTIARRGAVGADGLVDLSDTPIEAEDAEVTW